MRVRALKAFRGASGEPFMITSGLEMDVHPTRGGALLKRQLVEQVETPPGAPVPPDPTAPAGAYKCDTCHQSNFMTEQALIAHQRMHGANAGVGSGVVFKTEAKVRKPGRGEGQ